MTDQTTEAPPAGVAQCTPDGGTVIQVISFGPDPEQYSEVEVKTAAELKELKGKSRVMWVNIDGPVDDETLDAIGKIFELHPLALEDVVKGRQRAKFEEFGKNHFLVARMVALADGRLESEQFSLFFDKNHVITFQECPGGDCLESVRSRLRKKLGKVREQGADHLAYILLDAVIDGYFPVLEELGDKLETLEDQILARHDSRLPKDIHAIKRDIVTLRRFIWPLREAVNALLRDTTPMVSPETRIYLRDCYDHAIRLLDLVEMYRELCSDLMDLHLSSTSNRMNEVMKVLAIITTLFIPPTLIAGIYGMNFKTDASPFNMPELSWYFGYPFAITLMVGVMIGLYFWLRWKGWLGDKGRRQQ